jgi:hypothetical protein
MGGKAARPKPAHEWTTEEAREAGKKGGAARQAQRRCTAKLQK